MNHSLRNQDIADKIGQTGFLLFVALSFAFSIWRVHDETGVLPKGIANHYSGRFDEGEQPVVQPVFEGLPDDPALSEPSAALRFAMTKREMVEVTHVHLFMIPTTVYLVTRLFLRTRKRRVLSTALPATAYVSIVADLGGMWLTRFVHDGFGTLISASGMVLTAAVAWMITFSLYDMWLARGGEQ